MDPMNLGGTAVIVTGFKRPHYLRETLASWQAARGIGDVRSFTLALGDPGGDQFMAQLAVWERFREASGLGCERGKVKVDSAAARASRGMHRAIGEAGNRVFDDPAVEFAIFGEEDIIVSTDVLEYMAWAREAFAGDERVLCVCAHSVGGQGWDEAGAGAGEDADPEAVRLLPYFNAWVWGTWRDRWERTLAPNWDMECNSGGAMDSGYDHNIHRRIIPQGNYLCVIPDASRSQNIGRYGGWAANPADFPATQAASFRQERASVAYRLEEAAEKAA